MTDGAPTLRGATPGRAVEVTLAVARVHRRLLPRTPGQLSLGAASALATMAQYGPMTPAELADHDGVPRSTMARSIADLHERGLIQRVRHPTDRRRAVLSVTTAGMEHDTGQGEAHDDSLSTRLGALTENERTILRAFVTILGHLADDSVVSAQRPPRPR